MTRSEVLQAAFTAEVASEHPLGKAIDNLAAKESVPVVEPERFHYVPGKGIVCESMGETIFIGNRAFLSERCSGIAELLDYSSTGTEILVAKRGRLIGSILVEDVMRPQAVEAIHSLRKIHFRTELLTGDSRDIATAVAG